MSRTTQRRVWLSGPTLQVVSRWIDPIRGNRATRVAGDNATVNGKTDGTVYYTVGGGGRPRYTFQDGEGVSYRGNELPDTAVPNSYVWAPDGTKSAESITWSRVRFLNYSFVRVDVVPGIPGITASRMTIDRKRLAAESVAAWRRPPGMRARPLLGKRSWSAEEDAIALSSTVKEAARVLGRAESAVVIRRWRLRHADGTDA